MTSTETRTKTQPRSEAATRTIVVVGATSTVGRHVVAQAVEAGHRVTAVSRDRSRVELRDHPLVTVVEADAHVADQLARVIGGSDAVVVAVGAGRKGDVRGPVTAAVVEAMRRTGVRRLVCQSTIGVGDSRGNLNLYWKYLMFGALLRPAYADHVEQEAHVRASGLDWTIVRPGAFTDGERSGRYHHGIAGDDRTLPMKIARADVADFVLRQVDDLTYLHRTPALVQ